MSPSKSVLRIQEEKLSYTMICPYINIKLKQPKMGPSLLYKYPKKFDLAIFNLFQILYDVIKLWTIFYLLFLSKIIFAIYNRIAKEATLAFIGTNKGKSLERRKVVA